MVEDKHNLVIIFSDSCVVYSSTGGVWVFLYFIQVRWVFFFFFLLFIFYGSPPFLYEIHISSFILYMVVHGITGIFDHSGIYFNWIVYNTQDHDKHHKDTIVNYGFPLPLMVLYLFFFFLF